MTDLFGNSVSQRDFPLKRGRFVGSYYERNRDRVEKKRLEKIAADVEGNKKRCREYYAKNKERILGYKKKHREKFREEYAERARIKRRNAKEPSSDYMFRKFGITKSQYDKMLADQSGVCAICRQKEKSGKRLAIDHCHISGVIRGLLCARCNIAIGHLEDDPKLIEAAAEYLKSHRIYEPNAKINKEA